jgi:hypothetical protein
MPTTDGYLYQFFENRASLVMHPDPNKLIKMYLLVIFLRSCNNEISCNFGYAL